MNADSMSVDPVEIARLKQGFGASLSADEERLLAAAPPPRGSGVAWLRECLAALGAAGGPGGSRDPEGERRAAGRPDLVARFRQTELAKAEATLRRLPYFLLCLLGGSGLFSIGGVYAKTGGVSLDAFLQLLLVEWCGMGLFAFAIWRRARRILREQDLVRFVSARESGAHRSPAIRALNWGAFAVLLPVLFALWARRHGWLVSSTAIAAFLVAMFLAARLARRLRRQLARQRLREDRELWSWWYGLEEMAGSRGGDGSNASS